MDQHKKDDRKYRFKVPVLWLATTTLVTLTLLSFFSGSVLVVGFSILVYGTIGAALLDAWRQFKMRSEASHESLPEPNEVDEGALPQPVRSICFAVHTVLEDGVHVEIYVPPNERRYTSPVVSVSPRQQDATGAVYYVIRTTNSTYRVLMDTVTADRLVAHLRAWQQATGLLSAATAATVAGAEPRRIHLAVAEKRRHRRTRSRVWAAVLLTAILVALALATIAAR